MVEDHRAGLGVDRAAYDTDSAAGRRVTCPTLVPVAPIGTCGAAAHAPGEQRTARAVAGHHVSTTATALT